MPLTAAEKQRRYRARRNADPQRRADYIRKERESWHKRKVLVNDLSDRDKRRRRKYWKHQKSLSRQRKEEAKSSLEMTPPPTPNSEQRPSRQHTQGQRVRRKHLRTLQDKIKNLEIQLENQHKLTARFKKRWQREFDKHKQHDSPRTKTRKLLRFATTKEIRRTLDFHHILVQTIKKRYKETRHERQKQVFCRLLTGSIVRRYRMQKYMQDKLGFSSKRWIKKSVTRDQTSNDLYIRKVSSSLGQRVKEKLVNFFVRDDVSRLTTGKRNTLTRGKNKQQKRLLNDTLKNLHAKYNAENTTFCISFALFCRMRPFWVIVPTLKDRETCLCKICENLQCMVDKLRSVGCLKLPIVNVDHLVKSVSCDTSRKQCMYGDCSSCNEPYELFPLKDGIDKNKETQWKQWKTIKEERNIGGTLKDVTLTVKQTCDGRLIDLIENCSDLLKRYKVHSFNIQHQYAFTRSIRRNATKNDCIIHVDFAENYVAKMGREVQSSHFGASKSQISLHTGVYYVGPDCNSNTFCSLSDSLDHSPSGIWAHLEQVLDEIQLRYPEVHTIHFLSDGPTTQYRQKSNFFLFSRMLKLRKLKLATWNFFEAGHGKGTPDGVGSIVKRLSDRFVACGKDIPNALTMYEMLKSQTAVTLYHVTNDSMKKYSEILQNYKLTAVPGTMSLHQVISFKAGEIMHRQLSCLCRTTNNNICECYDLKSFVFPLAAGESTEKCVAKRNQGDKNKATSDNEIAEDLNRQEHPSEDQICERKLYFRNILDQLQKCKTYNELDVLCKSIEIRYDIPVPQHQLGIDHDIDVDALDLLPNDLPSFIKSPVFPAKVSSDGDCLPHSISLLVFGREDLHVEIRCRVVIELCLKKEDFLNTKYLSRGAGISEMNDKTTVNNFCLYSGHIGETLSTKLDSKRIDEIYCNEVLAVCKDGEYMGIWQFFALSSFLRVKLVSVYPDRGNPNVRKDLHRPILAEDQLSDKRYLGIMWTTTRANEMRNEYFVPNHFVPLVNHVTKDLTDAAIGKHVVVLYDQTPYPGIVRDIDMEDVQVSCMHQIGQNRFYWPSREDICWYSKNNIIANIPPPQKMSSRHFSINQLIWKEVLQKTQI